MRWLAALALLLAGCGPRVEAPPPQPRPTAEARAGDPQAATDPDDRPGPSGRQTATGPHDPTDGFPAEFPLPDDVEVDATRTTGSSVRLHALVPRDADAVLAFLDDALPTHGWTITERSEHATGTRPSLTIRVAGHGYEGAVVLLDERRGAVLTITLTRHS